MAVGRMRHDWDQTSLIWATLANTARDPKKQNKPFSPGMVHPLRSEADYKEKPIEADISILKVLLNRNGNSKRNPSGEGVHRTESE
jgi:hypothetical protein